MMWWCVQAMGTGPSVEVTTLAGNIPGTGTAAGAGGGGGGSATATAGTATATAAAVDGSGGAGDSKLLPPNRVFHYPVSVIFDSLGNLIVADSGAHCIRHVSTRGDVTLLAGTPGKSGFADGKGSAALFDRPDQLCLDLQGRILCCDKNNHRIRMITETGEVTTVAGTGEKGFADGPTNACKFDSPCGIAVDWKARIVVSDTGNHRIRRITPDGKVQTIAGNGEAGYWNGATLKESKFHHPKGLCFDRAGRLLVCDSENERLRRIGDGKITTLVGTGIRGFTEGVALESRLNHPVSVVCDRSGRLIICDSLNHRMRLYDNGQLSTLCGSGVPGAADASMGNGLSAQFRMPMAVVGDEYGHLVVADFGNHAIRVVAIEGAAALKPHPRMVTIPNGGPNPAALASPSNLAATAALKASTAAGVGVSAGDGKSEVPPPPPPLDTADNERAPPPPPILNPASIAAAAPPPGAATRPVSYIDTTSSVASPTALAMAKLTGGSGVKSNVPPPAVTTPPPATNTTTAPVKTTAPATTTATVTATATATTNPVAIKKPVSTPTAATATNSAAAAAAAAAARSPPKAAPAAEKPQPVISKAVVVKADSTVPQRTAIGFAPRPVVEIGFAPRPVVEPTAANTGGSPPLTPPVTLAVTPPPTVLVTSEPIAVVAASAGTAPAKYAHTRHPQRTGTTNAPTAAALTTTAPSPAVSPPPAANSPAPVGPIATVSPTAAPSTGAVGVSGTTTAAQNMAAYNAMTAALAAGVNAGGPSRAAPKAPKIPASLVTLLLHPGQSSGTPTSAGAGAGVGAGTTTNDSPASVKATAVSSPGPTPAVVGVVSVVSPPPATTPFTFTVTPVPTPSRAVTVNLNSHTPLAGNTTAPGSNTAGTGTGAVSASTAAGSIPSIISIKRNAPTTIPPVAPNAGPSLTAVSPNAPKRSATQQVPAPGTAGTANTAAPQPAPTIQPPALVGGHHKALSSPDVSNLVNGLASPTSGGTPLSPTTPAPAPAPGVTTGRPTPVPEAPPRTRASAMAAGLLAAGGGTGTPTTTSATATATTSPRALLPANVLASHRRGDSSESDDTLSPALDRAKAGTSGPTRPSGAPSTPAPTLAAAPNTAGADAVAPLATVAGVGGLRDRLMKRQSALVTSGGSVGPSPPAIITSPAGSGGAKPTPPILTAAVAGVMVTSQPVSVPPVATWLPATVLLWLKQNHFAPQLIQFIERDPLANAMDGGLLLALDEQMLLDCGVDNKLHRIKLLQAVASLRRSAAGATPMPTPAATTPPAAATSGGATTTGPTSTDSPPSPNTPPPPPAVEVNPILTPASPDRQSVPPPPPPPETETSVPPPPTTTATIAKGTPTAQPSPSPPASAATRGEVFPSSLLAKLRSAPEDGGRPGGKDPRTSDDGKSLLKTALKRDQKSDPNANADGVRSSNGDAGMHSSNGQAPPPPPPAAKEKEKEVVLTDEQTKQMQQRRAFHAHSPLSAEEERRLTPMLPLGNKPNDRANFDQFFAVLRSFDRTKWQWVLEAHLYMVATLNISVSEMLLHNWHVWLFPLMQRQNERQMLMDKEAERSLLSLVTLLISRVHFQKFMGESSRDGSSGGADAAGDASGTDGSDKKTGGTSGAGAAGAGPSGSDKSGGSGGSDSNKSKPTHALPDGSDGSMSSWLTNMVNHIAGFVWDEGSSRVVRMILCSFFNLVHSAALKNNLWRNNVTHPAWKNLFSALAVVEDFVFFRPLGLTSATAASNSNSSSSKSKSKSGSNKMGFHLYHKGCLDQKLVEIVTSILKALPIERLRLLDGTNSSDGEDISKLQKLYQRQGLEATAFFSALNQYMVATFELASKMQAGALAGASAFGGGSGGGGDGSSAGGTSGISKPTEVKGGTAQNKEQLALSSAQSALMKLCAARKRFATSGLFSSKGNTELKIMFESVEMEIQRKKNSKIFQPAVSFASLQDRKGSRLMSVANFEDPDELTRDDVVKLKEQCVGEHMLGQGSFGRVYKVTLFGMTWACKIVPFANMQGNNFRSEIRVHRKLRARRCVLFRGAYTKPPNLFILTEFVGKGDTLQDRVNAEYKALNAPASAATAGGAGGTAPTAAAGGVGAGGAAGTDVHTKDHKNRDSGGSGSKPSSVASPSTVPPPPPPIEDAPLDGAVDSKGIAIPNSTTTGTATGGTAGAAAGAKSTGPLTPPAGAGPGALTIALKLRVALQIVEGLNELHHQNPPVVHRDLKPTNVLLDKQCNVKLCDFGFSHSTAHSSYGNSGLGGKDAAALAAAAAAGGDEDEPDTVSPSTTPSGDKLLIGGGGVGNIGTVPPPGGHKAGTPLYKAPEAWDSDPDRPVGTASDIYSFGILLHELFCGRLPWAGRKVDQIQHLHLVKKQPPPCDPDLLVTHTRVSQIVESCTRHDDRKRPTSEQLLGMVRSLYPVYQIPLDDD